jgi:hypothetical protein
MSGNVLTALGVLDNEDAISNLLAYCANSSPAFARSFASAICNGERGCYDEVHAYVRKRVAGSGVPDLVLKARSRDHCDLLIIENKLAAEEGKEQTERYGSAECIEPLRDRLESQPPAGEWQETHLAFLTLFPWQKPRNPQFRHVTYEQLLSALTTHELMQDSLAGRLLQDLSDAYLAFYVDGRIQPDDLVMGKLAGSGYLDSAFLYFGNLFGSLTYPTGLQVERIDRTSGTGRLYYLAFISKDRWHPPAAPRMPGFNIHIEPQFNALGGRFSFFRHYEIRDYRPWKQAVKDFGEELHEYAAARQRFAEHLAGARLPGLELGGGSNQVAKMRVKLDGHTRLREFSEAVRSCIENAARIIDEFPGLL